MKSFYKSKEFYILGAAVLLMVAKFFGVETEGLFDDASMAYISLSPLIALILRLFFTKDKLTL